MYAVIMAGGRGTRFWPLSRETRPKQLLSFTDKKTIIQETVDRILPIVPMENILIVTGASHAGEVIKQFPDLPSNNVIIEPVGRNTAPCIGLAALHIRKKDPEATMLVLPSDHRIADHDAFRDVLAAAGTAAEQSNHLVTIGIKPTAPETGYGYIEGHESFSNDRNRPIFKVSSFREKPDLETARSFLQKGTFFWNSGMFIWKVSVIMEALEVLLPDLYRGLMAIDKGLGTDQEENIVSRVYRKLEPISIDYGVMEKADNVLLLTGDFGWNDLGSWDALWNVSIKDDKGNVTRGNVIAVDSKDSLVLGKDKLITLVGIDNVMVVETEDALLICGKGHSQDVKKAVDILEAQNRKEYL